MNEDDGAPLDREPIVEERALKELLEALKGVASPSVVEAAEEAAAKPTRVPA